MAVRTTPELVAGIAEIDSSIPVTPFISDANAILAAAYPDGYPAAYTEEYLEIIERWLSAHFYYIRDQRVQHERVGPLQTAFQYRLGLNLNATMAGQQALAFDTGGGLAALSKQAEVGKKPQVGVFWLGSSKCNRY